MFNYDRLEYQQALLAKVKHNKKLLADNLQQLTPRVFASPHRYYRNRAEFKIWHQGDICRYAVTNQETRELIFLEQFIPATKNINNSMPQVLYLINHIELLRIKLFSIEFCESTEGHLMITLIYHKQLSDTWLIEAQVVEQKLSEITGYKIALIGRSKGVTKIASKNYFINKVELAGLTTYYMQLENTFSQPNLTLNDDMLWWAYANTARKDGLKHDYDLLELYCGSGNFTLQLARNFRSVLATEVNKLSFHALKWNCENNQVTNIDALKMQASEVADCLNKVRPFYRARDLDLDKYYFHSVFVDPPRTGIDTHTLQFLQSFEEIIYISCNPTTLKQNLDTLGQRFEIKNVAFFDQFPYTQHLEVGVILQRDKKYN